MSSLRSDHESVVNSVNQDTSDCEIGETQSADAKLVMVLRPSSDLGMETGSQTSKTQQRQPEKIEGSQEDTIAPLAPWQTVILVLSLCIGTLLVAIDTTIVSVAIPAISTEFKALDQVGWYGASYLFTVTAFQPAFGSIYRFFDAKWTYLSSVLLFEVGSVLAAAAPNSPVFILGRAVQGVGAAGLYQGALAIISLTVVLEKRPMTIGVVLSVFGLATCFGPPVGGVFTDQVSWRWCWWINLPIGAVAFVIIFFILKLPATAVREKALMPFKEKISRLDFPGIVLVIGAVCCLVLALQWGGQSKPWGSADVIGLLVGAALLAVAFVLVQWHKGDKATIPLRIFCQRTILMGAFYLFFLEMAIYAYIYYLPFYFQSAQMVDATQSGVRSIPLGLSQIVAVMCCSALVSIYGHYVPLMIIGQLIAIIGTVFLTRLNVDTSTVLWASYLVITGIGTGMGLQMPFTGVNLVLSQDDIPIGNAITVFVQQLGAAIAVAIGESTFSDSLQKDLVKLAVPIPTEEIVLAGATGIRSLSSDPAVIRLIQDAYCYAFQVTMYFALAALVIAIPFAAGMEWSGAKKLAKARAVMDTEQGRD